MKEYKLIVSGSNSFSISNETDSDVQSDYSPGIWGLKTQKSALKYAKEYLAGGNKVSVTTYNEPRNAVLGNMFIKELGLSQPLFALPDAIKPSVVTNGKPSTLGALKKFLSVGTKVKIVSSEFPDRNRDTEVVLNNTTSCATKKGEGKSWIYWNKASDWSFDNEGATSVYINREGKVVPSFKIVYI